MFLSRARCRGVKSGHSGSHQQQGQSTVMWPKCGCPSGPLIPTYGNSIPTLLHGSTRDKSKAPTQLQQDRKSQTSLTTMAQSKDSVVSEITLQLKKALPALQNCRLSQAEEQA
ncbi:hypothetical protein GBF38_022895 [Nibea albiflora]|uniref:Uncharacterized protein n=1 Tax=Nibea albiflora TaxID=240163 RepID=A0ACB7EXQ4_NIBAL|nr:hypothetical protein GBF38_022895 [Nibea albiflora]